MGRFGRLAAARFVPRRPGAVHGFGPSACARACLRRQRREYEGRWPERQLSAFSSGERGSVGGSGPGSSIRR
jgi:hypothetical protein